MRAAVGGERTWSGRWECGVLVQGLVDVDSVGRQGSSQCGKTTCHQLSASNQLRAVDLREKERGNSSCNEPVAMWMFQLSVSVAAFDLV